MNPRKQKENLDSEDRVKVNEREIKHNIEGVSKAKFGLLKKRIKLIMLQVFKEVQINNVRNEKDNINFRAPDMGKKKREDIMNNFMIKYLSLNRMHEFL